MRKGLKHKKREIILAFPLYWLYCYYNEWVLLLYLISLLPVSLSGWSRMFNSHHSQDWSDLDGDRKCWGDYSSNKSQDKKQQEWAALFSGLLLSATAPRLLFTKRLNYRSAQFVLLVSWNPLAKWENSCTPLRQPWHLCGAENEQIGLVSSGLICPLSKSLMYFIAV